MEWQEKIISAIIVNWPRYFIISGLISIFMAAYGVNEYIRGELAKIKKKARGDIGCIEKLGVFMSEFLGSCLGWLCLYLVFLRMGLAASEKLGSFEVFLLLGAFTGIMGYAFKIGENIDGLVKAYSKEYREAEKN